MKPALPWGFKLARNIAVLVPVDGVLVPIEEKSPSLEAAQKMVEGYVEALAFKRDGVTAQALFNEEGLLKEMPVNLRASLVVGRPLVGPVIILTGKRRWT